MSDDRRTRSGDVEAPSAAVLDELLHAFSADPTDTERLAHIDLTSPEVAELIDPSPPPTPPPEVEAEPAPPDEVEPAPPDQVEEGSAAAIDPLMQPADDAAADPEPAPPGGTIVIAADDDLADVPDAVYVDGSLDGAGGSAAGLVADGGTVFIDDTSASGRVDATSATKIEPRFRQRRIAVRRAQGRRRLRWVIVVIIVLVLVVGALAVLGSSWFAISDVEVEGLTSSERDRQAVDAVVDDLLGTPVLRADTERAEAELEAIPWVEEAIVSTDFPDGARIEIRERRPVVAFEGPDGRFRVIDRQGRVLDVVAGQLVSYLRLESTDPPDVRPGAFAPSGYAAAAALVDALTPRMRAQSRSVFVTPDGSDLRLQLAGGTEVRFGRGDDLINKLVRLQTILDSDNVESPSLIDVSTSQVVVR